MLNRLKWSQDLQVLLLRQRAPNFVNIRALGSGSIKVPKNSEGQNTFFSLGKHLKMNIELEHRMCILSHFNKGYSLDLLMNYRISKSSNLCLFEDISTSEALLFDAKKYFVFLSSKD